MEDNGSLTRVAAFPIGIDPERFARSLERPDVRSNIAKLLTRYAGRKVRAVGIECCHSATTPPARQLRAAPAPPITSRVPH